MEIKVNNIMLNNYFSTASIITLASVFSFSALAAEKKIEDWNDFSDPTAIYSNASIAGGNEGVDISATYGGYLSGVYKHSFTGAVKSDLEYYEANYLLLNSVSKSGVAFDSTWHQDIRVDGVNYKNVNNATFGFFAKLGFLKDRLNYAPNMNRSFNFYPKVSVGYMWASEIKDTTFVKFDATTRFSFNHMFWVGVTPTYIYGMKGLDLNELDATVDAGVQLSDAFGLSVSANNDEEFRARVTFAF